MLHRVPPDIRILTPGRRFFSTRSTRRPRSAARNPATNPPPPAPRVATVQSYRSFSSCSICDPLRSYLFVPHDSGPEWYPFCQLFSCSLSDADDPLILYEVEIMATVEGLVKTGPRP